MNTSIKLSYDNIMALIHQSVKRKRPFISFAQELQRDYKVSFINSKVLIALKKEYELQEALYGDKQAKFNRV